ncbi:hypothetical protein Trydic_g20479 [Trypoxylus dichotomus]
MKVLTYADGSANSRTQNQTNNPKPGAEITDDISGSPDYNFPRKSRSLHVVEAVSFSGSSRSHSAPEIPAYGVRGGPKSLTSTVPFSRRRIRWEEGGKTIRIRYEKQGRLG